MNKRKIIILTILFVAIAGFALAPASAAKKTVKIYNKDWKSGKNSAVLGYETEKMVIKKSGNYYVYGCYDKNKNKKTNYKNLKIKL